MKDAPPVGPEMEARHLAACQVERIATAILAGSGNAEGYLIQSHTDSGRADYMLALKARAKYAMDQAIELAKQLEERFP